MALTDKLSAIGDAIRAKTGKTGKLTLDQMPNEIKSITTSEVPPTYVTTEANAVISKVMALQGDRTFTFAAITDMHYGNSSYTDGIKHACQAIKYINERIKLDAVAVLGDYTDGYTTTGIENAMGDFEAVNSLLGELHFADNIRQQGNHDYYPDNIPTTRRLIQYFSTNVVWGDQTGGYFYKDYENYKIRVICPNTNENNPVDSSNNHPSSSVSMTAAQINWLISTLDISAKNDAANWGILILSHQPLDYWTSDSTYVLGYILDAYKRGASWSGNGFSCNFSGKNKAKLIGNIHGHIHNLLTANMFKGSPNNNTRSEVYRSCVPNACYDRENQYGGSWGESTTYSKTKNSADDTAFMVYVVDLDTFKVNGICYGAGADRHFTFGEIAPEIFTITSNFTNITSNNSATTIEEGQSYTATLTPTGASIASVVVTMGGVNVTSSVYSNGVISIASVTGNIVITAVGAEESAYTNVIPLSINSDGTLYNNGQGWKTGYRLNSSGVESSMTDWEVTGFIPIALTDVLRFKNVQWRGGSSPNNDYVAFYNESFGLITSTKIISEWIDQNSSTASQRGIVQDADGNITSIDMAKFSNGGFGSANYSNWSSVKYVRFSMYGITNNSIITKNQLITDGGNTTPSYTNLLPKAINSDGSPYNGGQGWKANTRLSSSGSESTSSSTGIEVTGFMPAKYDDVVYLKNVDFIFDGTNATKCYFTLYDSTFKMIAYCRADYSERPGFTLDSNKRIISAKLGSGCGFSATPTTVAYFRLSADEINNNSIITVNEPIE